MSSSPNNSSSGSNFSATRSHSLYYFNSFSNTKTPNYPQQPTVIRSVRTHSTSSQSSSASCPRCWRRMCWGGYWSVYGEVAWIKASGISSLSRDCWGWSSRANRCSTKWRRGDWLRSIASTTNSPYWYRVITYRLVLPNHLSTNLH